MNKLNYQTLKDMHYPGYLLESAPERVLQFGEGNFLRGFVDYFIDVANEELDFQTKVVLVQPIAPGMGEVINEQEGLYTLYLRGQEQGQKVNKKRVISCVSRCLNPYEDFKAVLDCAHNPDLRFIVSNTTEAGIAYDPSCQLDDAPPASFPAKLTRFLYERYQAFGGQTGKGFVVLSCELIDYNGRALQECIMKHIADWNLGADFKTWVETENIICSTLVDRIVTGYPRAEIDGITAENGYIDNLVDTAETFGFWVIEGPDSLKEELPFAKAGLPVLITDDHSPYKQRKVRILNGAHTSMVLAAYLSGQDIVRDCMGDAVIAGFMNKAIYEEIIPTLTLPEDELKDFAAAVKDRFDNPFIDHALLSISLNSVSKWKARVLPSFKGYVAKYGKLPSCLTLSLAALIAFYRCERLEDGYLIAKRAKGNEYKVSDDAFVLDFFAQHKGIANADLAQAVCSNSDFWGEDLTQYAGLVDAITAGLDALDADAHKAMADCL